MAEEQYKRRQPLAVVPESVYSEYFNRCPPDPQRGLGPLPKKQKPDRDGFEEFLLAFAARASKKAEDTDDDDLASPRQLTSSSFPLFAEVEEEEPDWEKSSLCMYFYFYQGPNLYSLYVFNPIEGSTLGQANPSPCPVKAFDIRRDKYPIGMGSVELGSRVYFVGGQCKVGFEYYASKKVFALDFSAAKEKQSIGGCEYKDMEPMLVECSNMNVGKSNPLVMAASGKIYVLSCPTQGDATTVTLCPSPSVDPNDWTAIDYFSDWGNCAFEVFDPAKNEWTVLPLPNIPGYLPCLPLRNPDGAVACLPVNMCGYVIVHSKIFLCSWYRTVHTFDLRTHQWKYYDERNSKKRPIRGYDDALAYAFTRNGIGGRGLVVNDTLYALAGYGNCRENLWAYHLSGNLDDTFCPYGPVRQFQIPFLFRPGCTAGAVALQACLFHLGNGKFCSIHGELQEKSDEDDDCFVDLECPKSRVRFTVFKVNNGKLTNGEFCSSADILDTYDVQGIDQNLGSFFNCFAW